LTRVLVIINPVSGPLRRGRPAERVQAAKSAFDRLGMPAEIRLSERVGHAHELALEGATSGVDLVIAWGGDGTINEVGRALVQTKSVVRDSAWHDSSRALPALGIIPGGSGNGLARELRIPFDPAQAIERALGAPARRVDAGELGERIFFNIAGIGLDAHVAAIVSTRIKHRGLLPYLRAAFGDLVRYTPIEYAVTIDGNTFETSALLLAVANSKQYGFGAEIAPTAKLDDGLLDFVIVQDRKFVGNVARIPSMFRGRVHQQKGIITHRVREATIRSRDSMLFHVDGEAVQGSDTLVARAHPGALLLKA
jgi:YegS/Rv2252/BmrU family lipid kinase